MALKMAAHKNTLKDLLQNTKSEVMQEDNFYVNEDTPPPSDVSSLSPSHSIPSSPEYQNSVKEEMDDEPMHITRGMLDQSRIALAMFMLVVVCINPFGFVLNTIDGKGEEFFSQRRMLSCKSAICKPTFIYRIH